MTKAEKELHAAMMAILAADRLLRGIEPFCGMAPEDRMYHAKDRTWWRWDGDRLVRSDGPVDR